MPSNWQPSTPDVPTYPGNEPAAAGTPLNRGGIPNQFWGQQAIQSQQKLITEICMQVMKNMPDWLNNTWLSLSAFAQKTK